VHLPGATTEPTSDAFTYLPPPWCQERLNLLHTLLDAEIVPASGRRQWGALLRALGGEYAAIAELAPALPVQVRLEAAAEEE
jgi:hypothetical protein